MEVTEKDIKNYIIKRIGKNNRPTHDDCFRIAKWVKRRMKRKTLDKRKK